MSMKQKVEVARSLRVIGVIFLFAVLPYCGGEDKASEIYYDGWARPECTKAEPTRTDMFAPTVQVPDWGPPVRLGAPINTPCPEDAVEVSRDGTELYFMFTEDLLDRLSPAQVLNWPSGTYVAERKDGPAEFDHPVFFDLSKGAIESLDGAPSFTPDGGRVYFHSNRADNLGNRNGGGDPLDIYVAEIVKGVPGPGHNLGPPVNTTHRDGEPAIHPDGKTLYFASDRPGGLGGTDIWKSVWDGSSWSEPVNLGAPVNSSRDDTQPAFTADGTTMYFVSDREGLFPGYPVIYRTNLIGGDFSQPEPVIRGKVGEPSLTGDGRYLYFVHILSDLSGNFDTDIWYTERTP